MVNAVPGTSAPAATERGRAARLRHALLAAGFASALALSACGPASTSPDETPPSSPQATPAPAAATEDAATPGGDPSSEDAASSEPAAPAVTAEDIQDWIADTEWSFAQDGLLAPITLGFEDGSASDEFLRTYRIGVGVEGDANADGLPDLAVPVSQIDGNGFLELWYVWLGSDDGDAPAEQVIYPIARSSRCGDVVHAVTAIEGAFRVDHTLWMPHTDEGRDCAAGGTGAQVRDIRVEELDGTAYPVQTAPIAAWGGICPRSPELDWIEGESVTGRAAPPADAPVVIGPEEQVGLYALGEAPLLTADGAAFFGFQPEQHPEAQGPDGATPITMHCAFAN